MYKIIENDITVLEDEIDKIKSTNHLLNFSVYRLKNNKFLIRLNPLLKNSIRYHYFEKTYKLLSRNSIYILERNITDYLI